MRRFLSLILAAALLFSIITAAAVAASDPAGEPVGYLNGEPVYRSNQNTDETFQAAHYHGASFDSIHVNGQLASFMQNQAGGASAKLDAVNRTLDSENGSMKTLVFRGWIGFEENIESFGYQIDDSEPVFGNFMIDTEAAVRYPENGGAKACRYAVTIDVAGLQGRHTIAIVVKAAGVNVRIDSTIPALSNQPAPNTEILFRGPGSTEEEQYEPADPAEPSEHKLNRYCIDYVDTNVLNICQGTGSDSYLNDHVIALTMGIDQTLTAVGWAYMDTAIAGFGYRVDQSSAVRGDFTTSRPDVKSAVSASAEGFRITAGLAALEAGTHTVELLAFAADQQAVSICTLNVEVTDPYGINSTDPADYGLHLRTEEIEIPGLSREYAFLHVTDVHSTAYTQEEYNHAGSTRQREFTGRRAMMVNSEKYPFEYVPYFFAYADAIHADGTLLTGDIVDFPSQGNVSLLTNAIASAETPTVYIVGNHDWTYTENYQSSGSRNAFMPLYQGISGGDTSFRSIDYGEFVVVSVDNSDDTFTMTQYNRFLQVKNLGKPIILVVHVPFYVSSLNSYCQNTYGRNITLGGSGMNSGNTAVANFYRDVAVDTNSPVVAVIAGHLHTDHVDVLPNGRKQILTVNGTDGSCRLIKLTPPGGVVEPEEPEQPEQPEQPEEPAEGTMRELPADVTLKVSADQVLASDKKTDLARFLDNDITGTAITKPSDSVINAHGWAACSVPIVKYGYRYGDTEVLNTNTIAGEQAVLDAGAPYAGATGNSTRFKVEIPLDAYAGEVFVIARLSDGRSIDLWRITYPAKTPIPAGDVGILDSSDDALKLNSNTLASGNSTAAYIMNNVVSYPRGCGDDLVLRGWAYLNTAIRGFGYRIDGGAEVSGSFTESRPDVKSAIHETAEGFMIHADVSGLTEGEHTVEYIAFADNGLNTAVTVETVQVNITEGMKRPGEDSTLAEEKLAGVNYDAQTAPQEDATVSLWFDHITEKVRQNDTASSGRHTYVINMAGNSIEDCQFFLAPASTRTLAVELGQFTDESGHTLRAEVYKEGYYLVNGEMVPDSLPKLSGSFTVQGGHSQGFVIKVWAPDQCAAGLYSAQLNVRDPSSGSIIKTATVYVNVWGFSLSEATAMKTAFHADGAHDKALYDFMLENRICLDWVPSSDWAGYLNNPRVTAFCMNPGRETAGFPINMNTVGSNPLWKSKAYFYFVDEPSEYFPGTIQNVVNKGQSYANSGWDVVAPFFYDCTMSNGQDQIDYMDPGLSVWCTKPFAFTPREYSYLPGVRFVQSAEQDARYGDYLTRMLNKGEEMWSYVCCGPSQPYCNWMIQCDGIETIVSVWQCRNTHSTGLLYWNVNYANVDSNLKSHPDQEDVYGDGVLVTRSGGQYISTLRLEGLREGIQDYQMLYMLEQISGAEAADQMAEMVSENVVCYTTDDDYLYLCRALLGKTVDNLINPQPGGDIPVDEDVTVTVQYYCGSAEADNLLGATEGLYTVGSEIVLEEGTANNQLSHYLEAAQEYFGSDDVTAVQLDSPYIVHEGLDNVIRVVYEYHEPVIASAGGVSYPTFAEAAAAANGSVITLLADGGTYAMTAKEEILRVSKDGHSLTVEAPDGYTVVETTDGSGVTTFQIPYFYAQSVSTSGETFVNFYVSMPDSWNTCMSDYGLRIVYNGEEPADIFIPFAEAVKDTGTAPGKTLYKFIFAVPAKEMGEIITAQITDRSEETVYQVKTYSVEQYYYSRLQKSTSKPMKDLAAAALNYGTRAQIYFKYDMTNPVNAELEQYGYSTGLEAAPAQRLEEWKISRKEGAVDGFAFYAQSILFKAETTIRYYLTVDDISRYTFSYTDDTTGGAAKTLVPEYSEQQKRYYVEITGIAAKNIGDTFTVCASDGEQTASITYSVLTYIYNKYDSTTAGLADLVRSVYLYYQAALAWANR